MGDSQKARKFSRIKLVKICFHLKSHYSMCKGMFGENKRSRMVKLSTTYVPTVLGYHQSKVKYKVISIWPLLSSAQIHKEHSNTQSLCLAWGRLCKERDPWHPGPYCPKLNLVQHSPWGLAAIHSTISCLEQRVPRKVNLLGYTTSCQ